MSALEPFALPLAGTTLIEASAGTGKTHTITTLVLRLVLERELEIGQILVVTYTRAATFELRERVRGRLGAALSCVTDPERSEDAELRAWLGARRAHAAADRAALLRALRDFDQAAIFTIHGFCQRALTEHAFESASPFDLQLNEDERPLLHEIALDYYGRVAYRAEPELVAALDANRAAPSNLAEIARATAPDPSLAVLPDAVAPPRAPGLERFAEAARRAGAEWKRERNRLTAALTSTVLYANRYNPVEIAKVWVPVLDGLEALSPDALPPWLRKLTPDALKSSIKAKERFDHARPFFAAVAELMAAHDELVASGAQHALHVRRGLVDYARRELARRRDLLGTRGFDDLLHRLDAALAGAAGEALQRLLAERYPAALIDEFQDTDPVQYRIFRRCYQTTAPALRGGAHGPQTSLFLIGDPKQAIYGFRGADVFAYLQAADDARARRFELDVNRRSDPQLLAGLNALWNRGPRPFLLPEIRFTPVKPAEGARDRLRGEGAALQLLLVPNADEKAMNKRTAEGLLPARIAAEVTHLLGSDATIADDAGERPVLPRDIAVLCRTNVQARAIQDALAQLGVPTVLDGDSSVFDGETDEELLQVLWAVAAPGDGRKLGAALMTTLLGVDAATLERLRSRGESEQDWLERIAGWNQLWHTRGFMPMFHTLLDEADVRARLLARSDGERRLTDLLHLGELLHEAATRQHLGPLALLQWLGEMRSDRSKRADLSGESAQVRLEHDEHALRVATVHRSKGLEYPIVFAPFLWTSRRKPEPLPRFHDPADGSALKLDLGSGELAAHQALARREEQAEALRVAYVAMTRAKHRCYLVWGRFSYGGDSPLGYLLHHDERTLEGDDVDDRLKALKHDRELSAALAPLVEGAAGAIEVRAIRERGEPYRPIGPEPIALAARSSERVLRSEPRATSFSRLTAEPHRASGMDDGPDVDADAPPSEPLEIEPSAALALHAFPAGPGPGTLIHAVYENIDFRRSDPEQLPAEVARLLTAFGLDAALQAAVVLGIDQSLRTQLDPDDPSCMLRNVPPEARLNELEFTLCTRAAAERLSPGALAGVLARAAIARRLPDYAERVHALPNVAPAEFCKGFIDLVFRHRGRWFVVDYKSNLLGHDAAAYGQTALAAAMAEHHYVLQYHLYTLALHRYLSMRVQGYDYERDFGGVFYLFLRGMAPEHAQGTGVFFDRPELRTVHELGEVIGASGDGA